MIFFAIVCALLLEQAWPLARRNPLQAGLRRWARWTGRNFDAGDSAHGVIAWSICIGLPVAAVVGLHWVLQTGIGWPAAMLWDIAVLYATLGFRQFSRHFTGIREQLARGDEASARARLAQWQQVDTHDVPQGELVRHVIEAFVLTAHRRVFGVLAWYSVLAALGLGPAGAVLYRLAEFVARYWRRRDAKSPNGALRRVTRVCWHVIDWLPTRLTAASFAVVGSFEEAIDGWRRHARQFPDDNDGVILAATAGALNVRLGGAVLESAADYPSTGAQGLDDSDSLPRPLASVPTPGRDAELAHLRGVVGLVGRSVVMWLVLLALLTLARLL
ncbi:MAG: CobD/CbiB family protein [Burkholderiales bacterium]